MSIKGEWNGDKIKAKILAAEAKASNLAGQAVVGWAVELCPVGVYPKGSGKTGGNLRSSITHFVHGAIVKIGSPVKYAARIEFGFADTDSLGRTYHQPAQPYFRPALRRKADIKAIYAEEYKAAMK